MKLSRNSNSLTYPCDYYQYLLQLKPEAKVQETRAMPEK